MGEEEDVEVDEGGKGRGSDGGDGVVLDIEDLKALERGEEVGMKRSEAVVAEVKRYKFGKVSEHLRGEKVGGKGVAGEIKEKEVFKTIENVRGEEGQRGILEE